MQIATLTDRLRTLGAGPRHEQHLLRGWAQALPAERGKRRMETFLPRPVREAWPAIEAELAGLARLQSEHPGADGSSRLLVALGDGQAVESVLLPRGGLCVSTQVGCAVGCVFCMTGRDGLLRQLGSAEIVAQVALARHRRAVDKVVFMGMGEPAHNLDAVLEAIELLGTLGGIGHKNLVFSTVGDPRVFERLPQGRVKPALALSLHTTKAALREQLLPRAPRLTPEQLCEEAERYARATGYPVQFQWTLIEGVNDGDDEIEGIVRLLTRPRRAAPSGLDPLGGRAGRSPDLGVHGCRYAMMNLIPWNTVDELGYSRPSAERAAEMSRALNRRGILTRLRQSAGQDVEAGCGQLRSRAAQAGPRPVQVQPITLHR